MKIIKVENCQECPYSKRESGTYYCINIRKWVFKDEIHPGCKLKDYKEESK